MNNFPGIYIFSSLLSSFVSRIPNKVRKSYDTNLKLKLIIRAENISLEQESSGFHKQTSGNVLKQDHFQE
jgi:hypothetical protein